jgi:hypothetical protein
VTIDFRDSGGKLVRMETGLVTPYRIAPGEIGSFEVSAKTDNRYASMKLSFTSRNQESVSWTDELGKNAHP